MLIVIPLPKTSLVDLLLSFNLRFLIVFDASINLSLSSSNEISAFFGPVSFFSVTLLLLLLLLLSFV